MTTQTNAPGNVAQKTNGLMRALAAVSNDRQPEAQVQAAETEWRRQRDLFVSIRTIRDVLSTLVKLAQNGELSPLTLKGQLYTNNGNQDDVLDPPAGGQAAILVPDPTTRTGLRWDKELYAALLSIGGSGSSGSADYGLITEGVTVSEDYGGVDDPPLSGFDWGAV